MEFLFLYLFILILNIVILFFLKRHINKIIIILDKNINELLYIFSTTIYKNKTEIEKSQDEVLYLLFNNKNKYLDNLSLYNVNLYYNFFNLFKNDINYVSSFFQEKFLGQEDFKKNYIYFKFLFKICNYYNIFYILFLFLTLGIGKIIINNNLCKKFDNN